MILRKFWFMALFSAACWPGAFVRLLGERSLGDRVERLALREML